MRQSMNKIFRWWRDGPTDIESGPGGEAVSAAPVVSIYDRYGLPAVLNYPTTSLGQLLDQSARRFPDAPAMIYRQSRWTYRDLEQQVNRLAAGMAKLGVRKGDRVLMTLPNCPEFVLAFFAVFKLGAVLVNAGPLMGPDDMAKLIEMTEPRLVVGLDLQGPVLTEAAKGRGDIHWLWVSLKDYQKLITRLGYRVKLWQAGQTAADRERQTTLDDLVAHAPARPPSVAPAPQDLAVLQPTGGTTGTLKVAQLTHANLLANCTQLSAWVSQRTGQERVLGVLPMFHVYGLSTCLTSTLFGAGAIIPQTRFRVDLVLEAIVAHRPTVLPLVPAIIEALCHELEKQPRPDVLSALANCTVTSGAAPLADSTAHRFEELTGLRIIQGYGLTEASPVTHVNPPDEPRDGSIGICLPDTHARIVDINDHTRDMPAGEAGELWICGPQIMQGYLDCPEDNQLVLSTDDQGRRWLHTGDIARVDEEGYTFILDRQKDMIIRGGLKVYPRKVEKALNRHPRVEDAAVVGKADQKYTEKVVAHIVLADGPAPDQAALISELQTLCREHLAPYEVPQEFEFTDVLPRSGLGKLLKYQLREPKHQEDA
ncbi:MAG: AMP-binding protein [Phycisphaerae bacterium]|nr:AMP-binding protein [Phycisphaerae bacterium]